MNVKPGYYYAITLLRMRAGITDPEDAPSIPEGLLINDVALTGFDNPLIDCSSGTVTFSDEGDWDPTLSAYWSVGNVRLEFESETEFYFDVQI